MIPFLARAPLPVPTGTEAAAFDRRAIDSLGVPQPVLMENAGRSAALVLHHLHPDGRVVIIAGSGNNGGDGIVLARTLHSQGRSVRVFRTGGRPDPDPLLHHHPVPIHTLPGENGDLGVLEEALQGTSVVVDALLGTGIRGAPREGASRIIEGIRAGRAAGAHVIALDLPSGVDADTGGIPGVAVEADTTIAFGAPKLGILLHPGRAASGRIIAVEIGFPPWPSGSFGAEGITPEWAARTGPRRPPRTHKNANGRLLLVGGEPGMAGAVILAARAALRAAPGYLRIASDPSNRALLNGAVPEAVFVDALDPEALRQAGEASDAVAAGPGVAQGPLGPALAELLERLPGALPLCLDAGALRRLAAGGLPAVTGSGGGGGRRGTHTLLTPHPGEAAALLEEDVDAIVGDPLGAARRGAERWGTAFLLKGEPTVVAAPGSDVPVRIALRGGSRFARAGMGDVLTGVIGGFLARGLSGADAGALALHRTGRAADHLDLGESLLPSDLPEALPRATEEQGPGWTDLPHPFVLLDLPAAR